MIGVSRIAVGPSIVESGKLPSMRLGRRYLCSRASLIAVGPSLTVIGKFTSCDWAVTNGDWAINICDWETSLNVKRISRIALQGFTTIGWAVSYCGWPSLTAIGKCTSCDWPISNRDWAIDNRD